MRPRGECVVERQLVQGMRVWTQWFLQGCESCVLGQDGWSDLEGDRGWVWNLGSTVWSSLTSVSSLTIFSLVLSSSLLWSKNLISEVIYWLSLMLNYENPRLFALEIWSMVLILRETIGRGWKKRKKWRKNIFPREFSRKVEIKSIKFYVSSLTSPFLSFSSFSAFPLNCGISEFPGIVAHGVLWTPGIMNAICKSGG